MKKKIEWWNSKIQVNKAKKSISSVLDKGSISTGLETRVLEKKLEKFLNVKHVIAVSSGSMATLLALMAIDIKHGDEIIIPNIGWISIINACKILGATPVIVDVLNNKKIIDLKAVESAISNRTKCIFPINMNGRKIEIEKFNSLCKKKKIILIEDAAQALGIKYKNKFCGTNSEIGIFSMSITKLLTSGQGGFLVTNKKKLAEKIYYMRRHGFSDIKNIRAWNKYGGNFKITDIQSSLAIQQLKILKNKLQKNKDNFNLICKLLKNYSKFITPSCINTSAGEIPLYNEFKVKNLQKLSKFLYQKNIETRLVSPTFDKVTYMNIKYNKSKLQNSINYNQEYIYLPSGPDLKKNEILKIANEIKKFYKTL